jgi:hypothetical protein
MISCAGFIASGSVGHVKFALGYRLKAMRATVREEMYKRQQYPGVFEMLSEL